MIGQSVTFTANISVAGPGAGTPTGSVIFKDGSTVLGTGTLDSAGVATLTTTALSLGSHSITAVYGGDTSFASATSTSIAQTVGQANTSTSLSSSPHPSVFGQSTTLTAHVDVDAPGAGSPTGTITFTDGSITLGTATLNGNGDASITIAAFTVGDHSIIATYGGDTDFIASTSTVITQTVHQASTTTAIATSTSPSSFGQSVTLTPTVSTTAPGAGTPSGTVTFRDGSTVLGTSTLDSSGVATFSTTVLNVGGHSITATFDGDASFATSVSATFNQTVVRSATHSTLTSSKSIVRFRRERHPDCDGRRDLPGNGMPTGSVEFFDGPTSLGTATLDVSGSASLSIAQLSVGNHPITIVYAGDSNFASSTSASVTQHIGRDSTSTSITSSGTPSVTGQPVTLTATVIAIAPGDGTPSGTVTFRDGSTVIGTATLDSSGVATFTTATLAVGNHSITVVYAGDTDDFGSSSSTLVQAVQRASTTATVAASPGSSVFGQSIQLMASVVAVSPGDGVPAGTITFRDGSTVLGTAVLDGSGVATLNITALSVGDHTVTATYSGNGSFTASTSASLTRSVSQAASSVVVTTSVASAAFGETIMLAATVSVTSPGDATATGTITFFDGATALGTSALDVDGYATLSLSHLSIGTHDITASTAATPISPPARRRH